MNETMKFLISFDLNILRFETDYIILDHNIQNSKSYYRKTGDPTNPNAIDNLI